MANIVQQLGDTTTREVKPDFESEKSYWWMKQVHAIQREGKTPVARWPRQPRRTLAEHSFFAQVDKRLSRQSFVGGVSFGSDGKIIREEIA